MLIHLFAILWVVMDSNHRRHSQQIYSLPHLATLVASCRIRTNDPEITNHVLWPTELKRHTMQPLDVSFRTSSKTAAKIRIIF